MFQCALLLWRSRRCVGQKDIPTRLPYRTNVWAPYPNEPKPSKTSSRVCACMPNNFRANSTVLSLSLWPSLCDAFQRLLCSICCLAGLPLVSFTTEKRQRVCLDMHVQMCALRGLCVPTSDTMSCAEFPAEVQFIVCD